MYGKRKDTLSFSDMYHITLFNKSCCCTRDGFTGGGGGGSYGTHTQNYLTHLQGSS